MDENTAFLRGKEVNLCRSCSEERRSCCHGTEIYLTRLDVRRIQRRTGSWRFYALKYPTDEYVDDGSDRLWTSCVANLSRRRRVLRSRPDGTCIFHTPSGCSLTMKVRPLICRLYPFVYDEEQIRGVCVRCPISCQEDPSGLLRRLGMEESEVRRWHRMLYEEIRAEHGLKREGRTDPVGGVGQADSHCESRHKRYFRACLFRGSRVMRGAGMRASRPPGYRRLWWQSASLSPRPGSPVQSAVMAARRPSLHRAWFHGAARCRSVCCPGP